jgi:hypothetical protein
MSLVDLSVTGVMTTHPQRLTLGKSGLMTFPYLPGQPVRAKVVWSRYSTRCSKDLPSYQSGFEIVDDLRGVAPAVISHLVKLNLISYDEAWHQKKADSWDRRAAAKRADAHLQPAPALPEGPVSRTECLRIAMEAHRYLQRTPDVHQVWLQKARSEHRIREGESVPLETLAVWEFLRRKVSLVAVRLALQLATEGSAEGVRSSGVRPGEPPFARLSIDGGKARLA